MVKTRYYFQYDAICLNFKKHNPEKLYVIPFLSSQDISRPLSVPFIFRASGKGTDTAILTAKQAQLYFYILLKIFRRELMVYFSDIYFKWPQFCPHGISSFVKDLFPSLTGHQTSNISRIRSHCFIKTQIQYHIMVSNVLRPVPAPGHTYDLIVNYTKTPTSGA